MRRTFVTLIVLLAMFLTSGLAFSGTSPVILTHTLTGYCKEDEAVALDYVLHVENTGDSSCSDMTLLFVSLPPFMTKRTIINVGTLSAHQSADFNIRLRASSHLDIVEVKQKPLFWAGKCFDAKGQRIEFPATSQPGGAQ